MAQKFIRIITFFVVVSAVLFNAMAGPVEPSPENRIPADKSWPRYRGPDGTCRAMPADSRLVESFSNARLVWTSEEPIPAGRGADVSNTEQNSVAGGFASPIVANGYVYLHYYVPGGTVLSKYADDSKYVYSNGVTKDKWLVGADDIILCVDAQTGKTKWKKVFADKGYNWQNFNKAGPGGTPCYHDGKIYARGTTGRIYCVNAMTGDSIWESNIGPRYEMMEGLKEICLSTRDLHEFNRDFMSSPVVIGDAVVNNTHELAKGSFPNYKDDGPLGMIAHDVETGAFLWHKDACAGLFGTAEGWATNGKTFVLTGRDGYPPDRDNHFFCLDAEGGSEQWKIEGNTLNGGGVVTWQDYLFCRDMIDGAEYYVCYQMTLENPVFKWRFKINNGIESLPLVMNDHVYLRYKLGEGENASHKLACINIESGTVVNTITMPDAMGFTIGSNNIIIADVDHTHSSKIYLFDSNPYSLKKLDGPWDIPAANGYSVPITPAMVDGRLFIRHHDRLACYDFRTSQSVRKSFMFLQNVDNKITLTSHSIQISGISGTISIYDLQGKILVSTRSMGEVTIPLSKLGSGTHILNIERNGHTRSYKIYGMR